MPNRSIWIRAGLFVGLVVLIVAAFSAVDLFDARVGTPTLAQLQQYDIVMPFSNGPFADDITLGDNLADYVDGGGVVVQCAMSFMGPNARGGVNGRWVTGNYNPYNYSTDAGSTQFSAYIDDPALIHALVKLYGPAGSRRWFPRNCTNSATRHELALAASNAKR